MGEFEVIQRFFTTPTPRAILGVGDDCALVACEAGMHMAISSDLLVAGRHFFHDVDPRTLGHKALAVNLSDLAACGAQPRSFTLALALPEARAEWLAPFAQGLLDLARAHDCELIGGDTTRGPLTIGITVMGEVPHNQALLRSGARAGDDIYVSGTLGGARLALEARQGQCHLPPDLFAQACQRMDQPTPRIALGLRLRNIASAAADVSDGLLGDLGHILKRSGVGACVRSDWACTTLESAHLFQPNAFPRNEDHQAWKPHSLDDALPYVLAGGDDYELVFTAPQKLRHAVQAASSASATRVTRIGYIEAAQGLRLVDAKGASVANNFASFDHFS
jgi:thiamine-monophosphate kinase